MATDTFYTDQAPPLLTLLDINNEVLSGCSKQMNGKNQSHLNEGEK